MCNVSVITMKIVSIIILMVLVSGCWSSNEIEDLSLYLGLALDKGEISKHEEIMNEKGSDFPNKHLLTATVQIAPPQAVQSTNPSNSSKLYNNITQTGDSLIEILREFAIRQNRPVIAHHLKVVIISSELAKEQHLNEYIDFMLKDNDIRPNCLVFITTGKAAEPLSFNESGILPALYIKNLIDNHKRSSRIMTPITLNHLNTFLHSKQSFMLQNIISTDNEIKFSGSGIIKGTSGKWVGYLTEEDVSAINWITDNVKGGLIKSYNLHDEVITYEIKEAKSKIKSIVENGKISFKVTIKTEGRLIENWDVNTYASDPTYLKEAEKIFTDSLHKQLEEVLKKLQETYIVEVANFGKTLKQQHPAAWKKVSDQWDEEFSECNVDFDIKLEITDFGASTQ
ncbi:MAG: Ger(x)C family spore germination protein [Candidatus Pristimantibacillus lignocellulolyticus]|uniref:Ger(X)C family spore germination protein n=1 Tax=Candidatus Pristimantibacillus lignocellulolyticus TaxID=2994561 RepID=A0A9J6ZDE7_9BACL|nr:MAG: Ger(x)C family spore germination protein [Candidatus Pristimantibacillus lignocellulolyticus]